ncbi:MAG: hypothetical protein M1438_20370 [Deltaproteobacteria bacterium]|nr:hypothetical protein [Deltaproteobacteria bacterium]
MRKTLIVFIILAAGCGICGCGPTLHNIRVNGYTDTAAPAQIVPGGTFFVIENQKAQNPLLEKEIAEKIRKLLFNKGYSLTSYDKAQYYLLFSYGVGGESPTSVAMPDYYTSYGFGIGGGTGWGWYGAPYVFGGPFFSFYPSPERQYDRWLLINVVDGKYYRETRGQFKTIWVGEARSTGTSTDLRVAINYLLLADFRQFGQNTGKAVNVEVNEDAAKVQGLTK